jgi:hypothetical protein
MDIIELFDLSKRAALLKNKNMISKIVLVKNSSYILIYSHSPLNPINRL